MRGELARSMSAVLLLCHPLEADCLINNPNLFRGGPPCSIPRSLHARPGRHVLARTSVRPRTEGRRGRKCAGKAVQVPRTCSHALARLFTSCEGEWPRDFEARWVSHALPRAPMALHGTPSSHQQPPSVWQRAGESEQVLSQSRPHRLSSFQHQRRWTNRCQVSLASMQLFDACTMAHAPQPLAFRAPVHKQRFTLRCSCPAETACDQPVASLADK